MPDAPRHPPDAAPRGPRKSRGRRGGRRRRRHKAGDAALQQRETDARSPLEACRRTARETFGIERLRPQQESAMVAVLEGRDTLVALPTGFGKSLIYQVPAMMIERPTIVVSPLIALMADQEASLKRRGVTATATPRVRDDITARLGLRDPLVLLAPAYRENLRLAVDLVPGAQKFKAAGDRIRVLHRPGILYCSTTAAVDQLTRALQRAKFPVVRYHGKMRAADRAAAQTEFMESARPRVMVATTAFGMGIDKANIRTIIHYQVPGSLEQYVQEVGRAGRDGQVAHCILLFDPDDLDIQAHLQAMSRPTVRHLEQLEAALAAWAAEDRAPTAATLATSAGVPARIAEVLLVDLEEAGLVARDPDERIRIAVPIKTFRAGAQDLMAKLKTFAFEGERRLRIVADYAETRECRSVFLRRYFGEADPPRCGVCDRCRADGGNGRRRRSRGGRGGKARRSGRGRRKSAPT